MSHRGFVHAFVLLGLVKAQLVHLFERVEMRNRMIMAKITGSPGEKTSVMLILTSKKGEKAAVRRI